MKIDKEVTVIQNALLASGGWVLDIVFFLVLILGTVIGAYKGFVWGVCRLAGKIVSILFAVMFCVAFANFLELCFGMTTAITNGIASGYMEKEGYGVALAQSVTGAEISPILEGMGIGAFPRWLISISFSDVTIPAGTYPATLIASVFAKWISIVISFVLLIILLRGGVFLIRLLLTKITRSFTPLKIVDQTLGALLGLVKACFLIFLLLMLLNWIPWDGLHAFIESSTVVRAIFTVDWFQTATSYCVSDRWFSEYLSKIIPT